MNGSSPHAAVSDPDPRFLSIEAQLAALLDLMASQRVVKDYYTTSEVAKILNRSPYTVREWCRYGRVQAIKRPCGRGRSKDWALSHTELLRIQNEGLLPLPVFVPSFS